MFTDPDQLKDGPKKAGINDESDGEDDTLLKKKAVPVAEELTPE